MRKLALISPWFGPWPEWIDFTMASCAANAAVNWLIPTDQEPPGCRPANVAFIPTTFKAFCTRVSRVVGVPFTPAYPYKLCDIKPMFGHIYEAEIAGFRSWGFCDLDVIFGDILSIYNDDLLDRYAILSAAPPPRLSGPLCVFPNSRKLRLAYRRSSHWRKEAILDERVTGYDEGAFSRLFVPKTWIQGLRSIRPSLYVDRRTRHDETASDYVTWRWKEGLLTNSREGDNGILFLHFRSWRVDGRRGQGTAAWPSATPLIGLPWKDGVRDGFSISRYGFRPIAPTAPSTAASAR